MKKQISDQKKRYKAKFFTLRRKYFIIFASILLVTSVVVPLIAVFIITFFDLDYLTLLETRNSTVPVQFELKTALVSLVVGCIFISISSSIVTKPIKLISDGAKKVSEGDFDVQIPQVQAKHDELVELADNFNLMVRQLQKNEYLHKDFVSNVSHEFNTPIAAIQGYAELMSVDTLSDEKRLQYANIIISQSQRLSQLSTNLLKLSELDNKEINLNKSKFFLDEQIRDAILLLQKEWEDKEIELDIEMGEIEFEGDKMLMYQVWVNIISNAIKYTPKGGKISFSAHKTNKIKIVIEDTGIGMTTEQCERAFERFYKADDSRSSKGTGLGLSIAKKIVQIHGGEIALRSEYGEGTKFVICF